MTRLAVIWPNDDRGRDKMRSMMESTGMNLDRLAFLDAAHSAELEETGADYVILAGQEPLQLFRPDLHPGLCHGRPMLLDLQERGIIGFPMFHPESYARHSRWQTMLLKEINLLKDIARADFWSWQDFVPNTCVFCRGERHESDEHGVVYCAEHWRTRLDDKTGRLTPDQAAMLFS